MDIPLVEEESGEIEVDLGLGSESDVNIYNHILGEKDAVDNPNNEISEGWMNLLNPETLRMYENEEDEPSWIDEIIHERDPAPAPPNIGLAGHDEESRVESTNQPMPVSPISEENVNEDQQISSTTCRICRNDFGTKTELEQHLITDHNISITPNTSVLKNVVGGGALCPDLHVCGLCRKGFIYIDDYIAHVSLSPKIKCIFCPLTYSCLDAWRSHCLMMHCKFVKDFSCQLCQPGHELSNRYNLVAHYATHMSKNYHCPFCNEVKFKTDKGLLTHLNSHKAEELEDYYEVLLAQKCSPKEPSK